MRRLVAVAVVLIAEVLVAACSGGGDGKGGGESTNTTGSSRVVGGKAEGYSVEIPGDWEGLPIDQNTLQQLFSGEHGSKLDAAIKDQIQVLAGRGGKLFAYDRADRTTNLNVLKIPSTPGLTTEELVKGLPEQLGALGLRDVQVETVNGPGGPVAKASGTQPGTAIGQGSKDLFQLQYYIVLGPDTYVCILASDKPAGKRARLEAIGQTFTLVK